MKHTKEEYTKSYTAAVTALTEYVAAKNENKPERETKAKQTNLTEKINAYNDLVRSDAYESLFDVPEGTHAALEAPIVAAAKQYRFSGLLFSDIKTDSETGRVKSSKLYTSTDNSPDKKKEVFSLDGIEAKAIELGKPSPMASESWTVAVSTMQRLFNGHIKIADNIGKPIGPTADLIVYDAKGKPIDVGDMTDKEREAISEDYSIKKGLKPCLQALLDKVVWDPTGRADGQNKYRAKEADARYIRDHARTFDVKTHKSIEMGTEKAKHLAFCFIAHVLTGLPYEELTED